MVSGRERHVAKFAETIVIWLQEIWQEKVNFKYWLSVALHKYLQQALVDNHYLQLYELQKISNLCNSCWKCAFQWLKFLYCCGPLTSTENGFKFRSIRQFIEAHFRWNVNVNLNCHKHGIMYSCPNTIWRILRSFQEEIQGTVLITILLVCSQTGTKIQKGKMWLIFGICQPV